MKATILRQWTYGTETTNTTFDGKQDADNFEIDREWEQQVDDPTTTEIVETAEDFILTARGITSGGIRVVGTTERYTPQGVLDSEDYVRIHYPKNVHISKRDRIFNIRTPQGETIWVEEEFDGRPTVFEVLGVTPIMDPFDQHVENQALLQRAQNQSPPVVVSP
jgi:hypothetical protein